MPIVREANLVSNFEEILLNESWITALRGLVIGLKMMPHIGSSVIHPKPTVIWVVRHAEREDNVNKAWRRWFYAITNLAKDDSPLSKRGRLQAEECAARFANIQLDHVFSSPYDRCMDTAATIVRNRGMPIKVEPGLAEVLCLCENPAGFQDVPLLKQTYADVDIDYAPIFQRHQLDYAYERFRSDWVCMPRIRHTINHIVSEYSGSLLIVSHGAAIGAIHEVLTGKWNTVGQATVSKFVDVGIKQFVCEYSGDTSHLSDPANLRAY